MQSSAIGLLMTLRPPLKLWIASRGNTQRNERSFVMYDNMMHDGGMHGWMNGGTWVWPVLATLVAVLIVIVVIKLVKK